MTARPLAVQNICAIQNSDNLRIFLLAEVDFRMRIDIFWIRKRYFRSGFSRYNIKYESCLSLESPSVKPTDFGHGSKLTLLMSPLSMRS